MTTFWVLAAGLTGLALLFILPPLFRKQPGRDSESPDENQVNLAVFKQQLEELDADLAAGNLDQDQYASARRDLEKELLLDVDDGAPVAETEKSGRWAAAALALTVPAMALGMYAYVGDQAAIDRGHGSMAAAQQERAPEDMPPMEEDVQ